MNQTPEERRRIERIERLALWLDEAFEVPGLGYRVGWDGLIGLIPVVGDGLMLLLSSYIIVEGVRLKLPAAVIGRLLLNVLIEVVVGSVPVLGDIFDVTWKANKRNLRLIQKHQKSPRRTQIQNQGFWFFLIALILALLAGFVWLVVVLIQQVLNLL